MDEENYEAIFNALVASGDKDATRTVLCAQAFQYYTMYKRALSQGFSDAGAWPTYETHLQHAKLLQQFDDLANYKPVADSLLGSMVQGAILGATGAEMPAMREDGSAPNALDTLNAANEALARQNAEGRARLETSIAAGTASTQRPMPPTNSDHSGGDATAQSSTYYWYCYGQKKAPAPGKSDRIVSIYLGTVTSNRQDINGATELFRQHTSSDQASDTENPGAFCAPAGSDAEANERLQFYRSRDSRWPQVNVNLTM